jgi:hypothetical protein
LRAQCDERQIAATSDAKAGMDGVRAKKEPDNHPALFA